jgi:hypothetical protein
MTSQNYLQEIPGTREATVYGLFFRFGMDHIRGNVVHGRTSEGRLFYVTADDTGLERFVDGGPSQRATWSDNAPSLAKVVCAGDVVDGRMSDDRATEMVRALQVLRGVVVGDFKTTRIPTSRRRA